MQKLACFFLIIFSFSCSSRRSSSFNIKNFEKNNISGVYSFDAANGDHIQQFEFGGKNSGFVERIEKKTSPYGYYKEFFASGKLKTEGKTFYGFMIGIHKYYNEKHLLVNTVDFDKGFIFSIDNLIKKLSHEYHVDLLDVTSKISVTRSSNIIPEYRIAIPFQLGNPESGNKVLLIDATSGRVLSETLMPYTK